MSRLATTPSTVRSTSRGRASQHANRKLRDVADDIVRTGDLSDLPES
jgi:hypothetical protein